MENQTSAVITNHEKLSFERFREEVLMDYKTACISREASLLARKEVLTGKAKFGIFGDGKELAQVAMAKFFRKGDFRSGYYRDQTFMFASGLATVEQFFSQLFADPDIHNDPFSAGRQMNSHFATPFVNENGDWLDLVNRKNISADVAPTAGQMPRGLGLAHASKSFRNIDELKGWDYDGMCESFEEGIRITRETHVPVLFHVDEMTQPQGHSTSGSHERYKPPERLQWERERDGIRKMREWIVENALAVDE